MFISFFYTYQVDFTTDNSTRNYESNQSDSTLLSAIGTKWCRVGTSTMFEDTTTIPHPVT